MDVSRSRLKHVIHSVPDSVPRQRGRGAGYGAQLTQNRGEGLERRTGIQRQLNSALSNLQQPADGELTVAAQEWSMWRTPLHISNSS